MKNLKKDLRITQENLEDSIVKQASLFVYYGEQWAEANKQMKLLKSNLEVVYATVERKIRRKLSKKGDKVREGDIKAQVLTSEKYRKADKRYINASAEVDRLAIIKDALRMKKDMIEAYLRLTLSSLYSDIRVPDDSEVRGEISKLKQKGLRKKLKKSKK